MASPPTTVIGQAGRAGLLVGWVQRAWRTIQLREVNWGWMRGEISASLLIGVAAYTPGALSATRHRRWIYEHGGRSGVTLYDAGDQNTEGHLIYEPWTCFRRTRLVGVQESGRPQWFSLAPSLEIYLHPKPDAAYVLRAEYQKGPQELSLDADVPEMPVEHHDIIWQVAKIYADAYDENDTRSAMETEASVRAAMGPLYDDHTPRIAFAGPMGLD